MIGLIVPELFHCFFGEVAAGMSDALADQGHGLIISSSRDDEQLEIQEIGQMLARSVDALVVASCNLDSGVLQSADWATIVPSGAVGPVMVGIGVAVAALRTLTDTPVGKS